MGIAIVGFLLWHYDARPALRTLARERPLYFAATVAIYVAGQVMSAWRWQLLAAVLNLRGPFPEFVRYYFIGVFTNLFVPGLVGGDAARAFYLGRRHGKMGEAIASALADRGYGLLALFWFAALIAMTMNHGTLTPNVIRPDRRDWYRHLRCVPRLAADCAADSFDAATDPSRARNHRAISSQACGGAARDHLVDDSSGLTRGRANMFSRSDWDCICRSRCFC